MSTKEINTAKADLVRYILDETDSKVIEELLQLVDKKKSKKPEAKKLSSHLGKLKRGIDGLTYQKAIRNEWD